LDAAGDVIDHCSALSVTKCDWEGVLGPAKQASRIHIPATAMPIRGKEIKWVSSYKGSFFRRELYLSYPGTVSFGYTIIYLFTFDTGIHLRENSRAPVLTVLPMTGCGLSAQSTGIYDERPFRLHQKQLLSLSSLIHHQTTENSEQPELISKSICTESLSFPQA